jgi:hypothetical protein
MTGWLSSVPNWVTSNRTAGPEPKSGNAWPSIKSWKVNEKITQCQAFRKQLVFRSNRANGSMRSGGDQSGQFGVGAEFVKRATDCIQINCQRDSRCGVT